MTNDNNRPIVTVIRVPGTETATIEFSAPLPLPLVYEIYGLVLKHDAEIRAAQTDAPVPRLPRMSMEEYAHRLLEVLKRRGHKA